MTPEEESQSESVKNGSQSQHRKANNVEPAPKRRRVALACSACRIRKSRCNGVRPRCDTCEKLGFECLYEQQETSANLLVPKDLFAALEAKVNLLEANVNKQDGRLTLVEDSISKSGGIRQNDPVAHQPKSGDVVVDIERMEENCVDQSNTDGMAVSFVDELDCGFFGPSSNIALMRHIRKVIDLNRPQNCQPSSRTPGSEFSVYEGGLISSSITLPQTSQYSSKDIHTLGVNLLPPDEVMKRLISAYFANTGLLFPFIHQQEFLDTYERFQASGFRTDVRRTWLGLLNMILAMATCTSCWEDSGSETHFEESDIFYRRAQELCQTQMFRGTTLEIVQFLLLTSQYLQGTHKSVHTWTIHGLAVKSAMSIGLHSRDIASKFTPLQQEIRKRTWFGCILLDRSLSMTFGRPCSIPEEYIRLDLPKPLPPCASISDEMQQLSTAFYNASIKLYRIMGKIIVSLYGSNLGCEDHASDTSTMTSIIQFGQELTDWQNSLPHHLSLRSADELPQFSEADMHNSTIERFRIILTLRHLNIQLLLHRPMFIRSLGALLKDPKMPHRNAGSVNSMQASFDRVFVQVAESTIDIIYSVLTRPDHGRHLIGAWWFTLYYAFSAALAVFGGLLISLDLEDEFSSANRLDRVKKYLNKVSETLLRLSGHNVIVLRCFKFLQQLTRIVNAWDSSPRQELNSESQYPESHSFAAGSFDLESDLLSTMPTWEGATLNLGDELELGHFFASDSQRWFERAQW
ncbi:Zn2-C6 fungal-type domain-containing protein [Fusarium acuminatum]|uniref:Zn2-C6 fungal-type domain-containing protein n=1 Tax=Fusarium acuminatum TaxID=5515 RepID=A0ABZ2WFD1_9HYPO